MPKTLRQLLGEIDLVIEKFELGYLSGSLSAYSQLKRLIQEIETLDESWDGHPLLAGVLEALHLLTNAKWGMGREKLEKAIREEYDRLSGNLQADMDCNDDLQTALYPDRKQSVIETKYVWAEVTVLVDFISDIAACDAMSELLSENEMVADWGYPVCDGEGPFRSLWEVFEGLPSAAVTMKATIRIMLPYSDQAQAHAVLRDMILKESWIKDWGYTSVGKVWRTYVVYGPYWEGEFMRAEATE